MGSLSDEAPGSADNGTTDERRSLDNADSPLVREETRNRIQAIARELNYFVNRNAAGLRTHQSNTIAVLMFDETEGEDAQINPFFLSMLGYITRSASELGYDVLISMQQLSGNKIYVIGRVQRPGEFIANRYMDILQALSVAGGMTPR